jgi:hypothetical protein
MTAHKKIEQTSHRSMKITNEQLGKELEEWFRADELETLASKIGFIQRSTSRLTGRELFNLLTVEGRNARGEQRYRCQNPSCQLKTFMRVYRYAACQLMIEQQMTKLAINGSGVRETASVLGINKNTVIRRLKKNSICYKSIQT